MYIAGAILIFVGIIFNVIRIKWFNENDAVGIITIELIGIGLKPNKDKTYLIKTVMEFEKVPFKTAVLYFMIFTLESLGYHI